MFRSNRPFRLPPGSLAASLSLHAAAIVLLSLAGFRGLPLAPRVLRAVLIAPSELPVPQARKLPPPPRKFIAPPRRELPSPLATPVLEPPPALLPASLPAPPPLTGLPPVAPVAPLTVSPPPAPPVKVGTFETVKSSASTPLPPAHLKTAGFDTANSAAATNQPQRSLAPTGAFDAAPAAAGASRRGTLVSASGFGDARLSSASPTRSAIVSSTFGDTTVAGPTRQLPAASSEIPAEIPAEILDKPRPSYTEEARRLNIQGEVLLEVAFDASGQVRVLRVIRGLGHGLDETAQTAARQMHFRPARRGGQAVDSSAVVHIIFQLAY